MNYAKLDAFLDKVTAVFGAIFKVLGYILIVVLAAALTLGGWVLLLLFPATANEVWAVAFLSGGIDLVALAFAYSWFHQWVKTKAAPPKQKPEWMSQEAWDLPSLVDKSDERG